MRNRWKVMLIAAAAVSAPAAAQDAGGVQTETQRRIAEGTKGDIPWDLLGLLGLAGLIGLRRPHDNDGYTDDPI